MMLNTIETELDLLAGFTESETLQLKQALEITNQIKTHHPLRPKSVDVATILLNFNVDVETLLATLLSDPSLSEIINDKAIAKLFGQTVADLVQDVKWLNTLKVYTKDMANQPTQAETLRRMLLSMTHDVRAVLIKLAYRIQRLRILPHDHYNIRLFIAQETLDIYAPIANRFGVSQLKWELEDLSFRYLEPQAYRNISQSLTDKRHQRENCIADFMSLLQQILNEQQIKANISGRPKHIYSIWKKMQRKQLAVDELNDLLAVRVIVDKLSICYEVLGILHGQWQYIPNEFDDYIANPKQNGYQSLHTVIHDLQGNRIEIQIRTQTMHDSAELGVAAHWRYKEGGKHDEATDKGIASLRQLLEEKDNDEILFENFNTELFSDRVYVITPAGKLIDLAKGATPLDFAYAIHTEVGHRCRGAKINGHIAPLTYTLESGQQIEIFTAKEVKPNRNWLDPNLGYLKTPRAKNKVKAWFRNREYTDNVSTGKQILEKEIRRLGLESINIIELATHFNLTDTEKLYAEIGRGEINTPQIAGYLKIPDPEPTAFKASVKPVSSGSLVTVAGVDNILTNFAHCCNPIPGENIIGFISQSRGITIHHQDCKNMSQLNPEQQERLIDVSWGIQSPKLAVPVIIHAYDKQGLLNDVTLILSLAQINILSAQFITGKDLSATLDLVIQVQDIKQLSQALAKIVQLPNIIDAKRKS